VATNINAAVAGEKRRRVETEELRVIRSLTHAVESATRGIEDRTSLLDLRQFPARGD
jgi:hypothetical protein